MNVGKLLMRVSPPFLWRHSERIRGSPIGTRLVHNAFWSLAGGAFSRGSSVVAGILIARMVGRDNFGELGIVLTTIGMFQVFAGFGIGMTATKFVAAFRTTNPSRAGRIIALSTLVSVATGVLMMVLLALFSPVLSNDVLAAPQLGNLLRVSSLALLFGAVNGCQTGILAGFEAFKIIARINVVSGTTTSLLMVAGARQWGLVGAVGGMVVAMGFTCVVNSLAVRQQVRLHEIPSGYRGCQAEWPILWAFGLPAVLCGVLHTPVNWVCAAMLANRPNGYGELGTFNVANQWFGMLLFFPQLLGQAVLPVLSERASANDAAQSRNILLGVMAITAFAMLPIVLLAAFSAGQIVKLYGSTFSGGDATLIIMIITGWWVAVISPVGQVMAAVGKMWTGFLMNLGWAIVFIAMASVLVKHGALGLASAHAAACVVHSIWVLAFAYFAFWRAPLSTTPAP